jgi:sortase A
MPKVYKWFTIKSLLLTAGVMFMSEPVYFYTKGYLAQILLERAWNMTMDITSPQLAWPWARSHPVGKIYFPRLGKSFTILNDTSNESLAFGPGNVENTSRPGEGGNICIAGHRDSFFSGIKDLRIGDVVRIDGIEKAQLFQIEKTDIVFPDKIEWIQPTDNSVLTLITCYPFEFIGEAPQRYIIRAVPIHEDDQ